MPKRYLPKLVKAEGDKPAEILVHGPIGNSWWSDEGITGKEFTDALNEIPKGQKVVVGVNSEGGTIAEGLAIYNAIRRRKDDVTCRIDGYACSISSFFPLAASRVISPSASIWMIHQGWTLAQGNSEELRRVAELLDIHDKTIIAGYTQRTGKSEDEVRQMMSEETWFTGSEAVAMKFADEEADDDVYLSAIDFAVPGWKAGTAALAMARALAPRAPTPEPKVSEEHFAALRAILPNLSDSQIRAALLKAAPTNKP